MARLVLFGPGYTGSRIADAVEARGWHVTRIGRGWPADDVALALRGATHVVSTVAPEILPSQGRGTAREASGGGVSTPMAGAPPQRGIPLHHPADGPPPFAGEEQVLGAYGALIARVPWIGYLSSTGVYGDAGGAWVDETAPLLGRRLERIAADRAWQGLGARVFRLPGIYGPGRSPLDRVRAGASHRIDLPEQVFSRVHVDDIVGGVLAGIDRGPAGVYNLADDLPVSQNVVVEAASALLGLAPPPLLTLAEANLSPMARAFYAENRRVANGRAKRLLGWALRYPDYRAGLRALIATSSPAMASAAPAAATGVHT